MINSQSAGPVRDIYSVSRLNREARGLLENALPLLWVEAEISNLARPSSGHLYFTLKDSQAQVSCAMFRNRSARLAFKPEAGLQVLVRARVSLYEPRGGFQLIVEHMEEAGDGALQRAFEALKKRLQAEGLFDTAHKKPLPAMPRCIGVITSPGGAAIRDVLTVLKRRYPLTRVVVYPTLVQGNEAADQIVRALQLADARGECDVLLLTRGGGSLEDLWPFNEENVARAVFDCRLPIVSAVGHEVDTVITDFVADQRAATPSAAAELLTPDVSDWLAGLASHRERLLRLIRQRLQQAGEQCKWLTVRLQQQHPGQRLLQQSQRLDELEQRLKTSLSHQLHQSLSRIGVLRARLLQHNPINRLERCEQQRQSLSARLRYSLSQTLAHKQQALQALSHALDTVSPLATLQRGYSITLLPSTGQVVKNSTGLSAGDTIETRLAQGVILSTVTETRES